MKKICCMLTGKIYAAKRQYPVITQFEKRMHTVKKELNKDMTKRDKCH